MSANKSPIPANTEEEMQISAFLNQYVYADLQGDNAYTGKSIREIVTDVATDDFRGKDLIVDLIQKNPDYGDIILTSQSTCDGGIGTGDLVACSFRDPKTGTNYVSYRGTGDGKWVDNGDAMGKEYSHMQEKAADYFDTIVDKGIITGDERLIVTGHSKGGNSAQYAMMASDNGHLIDNCYSMNGQGFSDSALEAFQEKHGENYDNMLDKMYSINGHNDYVHDLGHKIIPEEHTYFFESQSGSGPAEWHEPEGFFSSDGKVAFDTNELMTCEQGLIGELANQVSTNMMALGEEDTGKCARIIMQLAEIGLGDDFNDSNSWIGTASEGGVNSANFEDFLGFCEHGIPVILNTVTSEETWQIVGDHVTGYVSEVWDGAMDKAEALGELAFIALYTPAAVEAFMDSEAGQWLTANVIEGFNYVSDKADEYGEKIHDFLKNTGSAIKDYANKKYEDFTNFYDGVKDGIAQGYAKGKDYIKGKYEEAKSWVERVINVVSGNDDVIFIKPDGLSEQANNMKNFQREYTDLIQKLTNLIITLKQNNIWDTSATTIFINNYLELKDLYDRFGNALLDYANIMEDVASRMQTTDNSLAGRADAMSI